MIVLLTAVFGVLVGGLVAVTYLLGFQLGGSSMLEELTRLRADAVHTARQMDTITRQAITAMLDEAQRRRQG